MNSQKLKAKIMECGKNVPEVSRFLGISPSTFYRKANGDGDFTVGEAEKMGRLLNMNKEEMTHIFLT